jgi:hypothetical protein
LARDNKHVIFQQACDAPSLARYTMVYLDSDNWRLTFEFNDGDAYILDYEDYH